MHPGFRGKLDKQYLRPFLYSLSSSVRKKENLGILAVNNFGFIIIVYYELISSSPQNKSYLDNVIIYIFNIDFFFISKA
jgi:hypothetical protein